jgi:hypothetical protein
VSEVLTEIGAQLEMAVEGSLMRLTGSISEDSVNCPFMSLESWRTNPGSYPHPKAKK